MNNVECSKSSKINFHYSSNFAFSIFKINAVKAKSNFWFDYNKNQETSTNGKHENSLMIHTARDYSGKESDSGQNLSKATELTSSES